MVHSATGNENHDAGQQVTEEQSSTGRHRGPAPATPTVLRRLIGVQGALLGWTLTRQAGPDIFDAVEQLRATAKELAGMVPGLERRACMRACISDLAARPTAALAPIVRAYCEYFLVINPAEEAFGQFQRERTTSLLEERVVELAAHHGGSAVAHALTTLRLVITLTAHPTEVRRPPVIRHQSVLRAVLLSLLRSGALDDAPMASTSGAAASAEEIADDSEEKWQEAIDALALERTWASARLVAGQPEAIRRLLRRAAGTVEALWAIDPHPARRPTVREEIDYYHSYLPDVLCHATVRVARHLADIAERLALPLDRPLRPIAWGFWPGGDRDGHPGVTWEITRAERRQIGALVVERFYLPRLHALAGELAAEIAAQGPGEVLLAAYRERFPAAALDSSNSPFAHLLLFIAHRLSETPYGAASYNTARELEDDLRTLQSWLRQSRLPLHAEEVGDLAEAVHLFGFILAPLDIRQHATVIRRVVAELLPPYAALEYDAPNSPRDQHERETARLEVLERVLAGARPEGLPPEPSHETRELLRTLDTVGWAAAVLSGPAIRSIIISGAERASDVLALLYLLERTGYRPPVGHGAYLVPLFETVEDIEAAQAIFKRLLASAAYRQYCGKGLMEIMLGYSDSTKTGGLLSARWALQTAQEQLWATAQSEGVRLRIFHGRGGTISRGGGGTPAQKIAAQPPSGPAMRVTYQGEEVARWFGSEDSAVEILESSLAALLDKQFHTEDVPLAWREALDEVSGAAMEAYRTLLARPDFLAVFLRAVPIGLVEEIGVGSRPPRRAARATSVNDLRAITWVWSWSVMRSGMTSWFGVGSGLAAFAARHGEAGREALRDAYGSWPFFRRLMDDIQVALLQADGDVAALHALEAADDAVFAVLEQEYELTRRELALIVTDVSWPSAPDVLGAGGDGPAGTGLGPELLESVRLRAPYLLALNLLLLALRNREEDAEVARLKKLCLAGLAQGLRASG